MFHDHTKHIEVNCHFIRDKVLEGLLQLSHLPTDQQLVDVFTKILPSHQFRKLFFKLDIFVPPILCLRGDVDHS